MTLLDQYQYYINNLPRLFSYTLTVKFRFANKIAFRVPTLNRPRKCSYICWDESFNSLYFHGGLEAVVDL